MEKKTFHNYPKKISKEEYVSQENAFVNHVKKIKGVEGIYLIGELEAPGVSDLDFLIKVNKKFNAKHSKLDINKYSLIDSPRIVDEKLFRDFNKLTRHRIKKVLYGKKTGMTVISKKEQKYYNICFLHDGLFRSTLRNLFSLNESNKINIKKALSQVYDVRIAVEKAKALDLMNKKELKEYEGFVKEFKEFRTNWAKHINKSKGTFEKKLVHYIKFGLGISMDLVLKLDKKLFEQKIVICSDDCAGIYSGSYPAYLIQHITDKNYLFLLRQMNSSARKVAGVFPSSFMAFLHSFSGSGIFEKVLRKNLKINGGSIYIDNEMKSVLLFRSKMFSYNLNLIKKLKYPSGWLSHYKLFIGSDIKGKVMSSLESTHNRVYNRNMGSKLNSFLKNKNK